MTPRPLSRTALLVAPLLAAGAAQANLLENGRFDEPDSAGTVQNLFSPPAGFQWQITPDTGGTFTVQLVNTFWAGTGGTANPDGEDQSIDIDGNAILEQTVATSPGTEYRLSFAYSHHPGASSSTGHLEVEGGSVLVSDTLVHSIANTQANMEWTPYSVVFTADSASTTVRFQGDAANMGFGFAVDDAVLCSTRPDLENRRFDTPDTAGTVSNLFAAPSGFGWGIVPDSGGTLTAQIVNTFWAGTGGTDNPDGEDQSVDIDGDASIAQCVSTVVGETYRLDFSYSHHPGQPSSTGFLSVRGDTELASETLVHSIPNTQAQMRWQPYSTTFVADSEATTVRVQGDEPQEGFGFAVDAFGLCGSEVDNDRFDVPDIAGTVSNLFSPPPGFGWTITPDTGGSLTVQIVNTFWDGIGGTSNPDGVDQSIDIDGDARMTQCLATTPGTIYRLRFSYSHHPGRASSTGYLSVDGATPRLSATLVHSTPNTPSDMEWTLYDDTFVADSTTTIISLQGDAANMGFGFAVDAFAVDEVGPVPALGGLATGVLALAVAALGGGALLRRRR